jgi:hypothetical protein
MSWLGERWRHGSEVGEYLPIALHGRLRASEVEVDDSTEAELGEVCSESFDFGGGEHVSSALKSGQDGHLFRG